MQVQHQYASKQNFLKTEFENSIRRLSQRYELIYNRAKQFSPRPTRGAIYILRVSFTHHSSANILGYSIELRHLI